MPISNAAASRLQQLHQTLPDSTGRITQIAAGPPRHKPSLPSPFTRNIRVVAEVGLFTVTEEVLLAMTCATARRELTARLAPKTRHRDEFAAELVVRIHAEFRVLNALAVRLLDGKSVDNHELRFQLITALSATGAHAEAMCLWRCFFEGEPYEQAFRSYHAYALLRAGLCPVSVLDLEANTTLQRYADAQKALLAGQPAQALDKLRQVTRGTEHLLLVAMTQHSLGNALARDVAVKEAVRLLEGPAQSWPHVARHYPMVAVAYLWMGDMAKALEWTQRAAQHQDCPGAWAILLSPFAQPSRQDPYWAPLLRVVEGAIRQQCNALELIARACQLTGMSD